MTLEPLRPVRWYQKFYEAVATTIGAVASDTNSPVYYRTRVATLSFAFLACGLLLVLVGRGGVTGLLWALACYGIGTTLGFLFGIPRTVQRRPDNLPPAPQSPAPNAPPSARAASPRSDDYRQYVNTNLEDISDWLTKIIVGLTLVKWQEAVDYFRGSAAALAAGYGGDGSQAAANLAYAQGVIAYFSVLGALSGYLLTRLFLAVALRVADQTALDALEQKLEQARQEISAVREEVAVTMSGAKKDN